MNDYSVLCLLFFLRLMECSCSSLIVLSLISMSTADWDLTSPLLSDLTSKVVVVVSLLLKEDLDFIIDYWENFDYLHQLSATIITDLLVLRLDFAALALLVHLAYLSANSSLSAFSFISVPVEYPSDGIMYTKHIITRPCPGYSIIANSVQSTGNIYIKLESLILNLFLSIFMFR